MVPDDMAHASYIIHVCDPAKCYFYFQFENNNVQSREVVLLRISENNKHQFSLDAKPHPLSTK